MFGEFVSAKNTVLGRFSAKNTSFALIESCSEGPASAGRSRHLLGQRGVPESRSKISMSFLFFSMHFKGILVGGETPGLLPMRDPPGEANAARRSDAVWIRWKGSDAT